MSDEQDTTEVLDHVIPVIKAGSTVIFEATERLSMETADRLKQRLEARLGDDVRVLIVDGLHVGAVQPAE